MPDNPSTPGPGNVPPADDPLKDMDARSIDDLLAEAESLVSNVAEAVGSDDEPPRDKPRHPPHVANVPAAVTPPPEPPSAVEEPPVAPPKSKPAKAKATDDIDARLAELEGLTDGLSGSLDAAIGGAAQPGAEAGGKPPAEGRGKPASDGGDKPAAAAAASSPPVQPKSAPGRAKSVDDMIALDTDEMGEALASAADESYKLPPRGSKRAAGPGPDRAAAQADSADSDNEAEGPVLLGTAYAPDDDAESSAALSRRRGRLARAWLAVRSPRALVGHLILSPAWAVVALCCLIDRPFRGLSPTLKSLLGYVGIATAFMAAVAWAMVMLGYGR